MGAKRPQQMIAIAVIEEGAHNSLRANTLPLPQLRAGEILIEVAAAGVNRPDYLQRRGLYPPPPGASPILGLEVSGIVVDRAADARRFRLGDPVCALLAGGGYAQYAAVAETQVLPVPKSLPLKEAAALPETLFTVWSNVFERGYASEGETLLVHGGASGIGTMAIQLGKAFGLHVLVTAGSDDKCARCKSLGADDAVNYKTQDFVTEVMAATNNRGVDIILDMVGGDYLPRNVSCLAENGRHLSIAFLRGAKSEIDIQTIMRKRLTLTGSTLRNRSADFKSALRAEIEREVWPLVASGDIRPVIDSRFALEDAEKAHARLTSGAHVGKILLEVKG